MSKNDEVLFSTLNHAGASMPWKGLSKIKKFKVRTFEFPLDKMPKINQEQIVDIYISQIRSNT